MGDDDAARAEGAEHQRPTPICREETGSNATRTGGSQERSPATWSSCSTGCRSRTFEEQVEGTKAFFRELNRLGLTGVVDPGGNNVTPREYQALFKVWRDKQLTLRVAYSLCGMTDGSEFEEYQRYLAMMPQGFGDDMLRFNGIGERITWAMNGINGIPPDTDKQKYYEIVRWAAQRGLTVTMHWNTDANVDHLLGIWERVNREFPSRRFDGLSRTSTTRRRETLQRMKALGIGWTVQDARYNSGDDVLKERRSRRRSPTAAGRDGQEGGSGHRRGHRCPSRLHLQPVHRAPVAPRREERQRHRAARARRRFPSRAEALRFYTAGSAWVSHDEDVRGSLEVGKLADLAVLSKDYMTVPVDQIGDIESVLTMVGGRVVYAAGSYKALENSR